MTPAPTKMNQPSPIKTRHRSRWVRLGLSIGVASYCVLLILSAAIKPAQAVIRERLYRGFYLEDNDAHYWGKVCITLGSWQGWNSVSVDWGDQQIDVRMAGQGDPQTGEGASLISAADQAELPTRFLELEATGDNALLLEVRMTKGQSEAISLMLRPCKAPDTEVVSQ